MLDTRSKMRVEAVCGRWKRIMVHYSWKTTTRFVASDILPHSNQKFLEEFKQAQVWMKKVGNLRMVRLLKKCAAHLQEVDLSGLASYTFFEHYWRIVLSRIPAGQLEYLDLSNIPMYYWDLQRVVERFADLKTVKLRNISSFYYCMEHFFAQCSLLETLDFGANILDTTSLQRLPPTLRSLNLSQCSEITGGVIEYNLNLVSTTCPKLECLELDLRNDESIVIGDGLHTALSNLKCLQKLVLRGKTTILDFGGLPHMPALKNLTIEHQFYTLNDDLFRWIGECSQLETLHLLESYTWGKWYTGNGLLHLKNLRQLKCLGLVAKKLTDVCLMAIANSNPELQQLLIERCHEVSDKSIIYCIEKCKQLVQITLGDDNRKISKRMVVEKLVAHLNSRHGRKLAKPDKKENKFFKLYAEITDPDTKIKGMQCPWLRIVC